MDGEGKNMTTPSDAARPMNHNDYRAIRGILHHHGRLAAIRWLRAMKGLPFLVARMVVGDVAARARWTHPPRQSEDYREFRGEFYAL